MLTILWRSFKSWKRDKGLAFLAIVALAAGIGAATAIFTIVHAVLLKPLPYTHGERWVELLGGSTREPDRYSGLTFADAQAYQQRLHSFEIFGWSPVSGDFNLTSPGPPRHIDGIEVTPSVIANTGVNPLAGRFFSAADGPNVALISHRLFKQLGSEIINRPLTLNGETYTVVGVMPAWFRFPLTTVYSRDAQNDVWVPIKTPRDEEHLRNYAFFAAYGRLKPGVTVAQARADAKRVAEELRKQYHPADPTYTAVLLSLQDSVVKAIRPVLLLLFSAAGLLLLITCANVAGLLVGRSIGRARETAIRVALGGGQLQLGVQYFFESLWISLAACLGGILASVLLVRLVMSLAADYIPRSDEVSTNWTVGLFAVGLAFLAATLSALAPLWQALRTPPNEILSEGVRASAGARSRKLSQALVIAEIALAFTLICAGALLSWQLRSLNHTSPGFDPNGLLTFQLTRSGPQNADAKQTSAYADRLLVAIQAIPGVTDAAVTNQLPLAGCCFTTSLFPEARSAAVDFHQPISLMAVSPSYFKTLRIPIQAGRLLNAHDTNESALPTVIDEAAAKRYWPGRTPVGEFARLVDAQNGSRVQIVGVVGTVRNEGLAESAMPEMYLVNEVFPLQVMNFAVRSSLPPASLAPAIRRAIAAVDPSQPIYAVRSMPEILSGSLFFERIESIVIVFFALAALLMASLGVYGLISYSVRQRTVEIGTRMAVGATGQQVLTLIAGNGFRLSVYGILVGALAVAGSSVIVVRYFKVNNLSPVPYLSSVVVVVALALIASLIPAWRASLLSPLLAIRNESDSIWTSALRTLERVRERISTEKTALPLDATLLTEFIEASRQANSFAEALTVSLRDLAVKIHSESALLLEKVSPSEFRCVAAHPERKLSALSIPENAFLLNRLKFYGSPLSFSSADLETSLRWAKEQRPEKVAELELLAHLGLRLAVPLRTKNDLIGLLLFGEHIGQSSYTSPEKTLLAACAEQFSLTMENGRLNERVLEQEKVRRDLALASEVQRRLLPETAPQTAETGLGAYSLAARNVGGDYYDFLRVGDHTIGIALADVAGKGIAAALIMAVVQASLRVIADDGNVSLPDLAAKMNRFLHRSTGFNSYATFFYAQLDEDTRQLRYVNAGHNPPYLVRAYNANRPIEELSTGGMIIGMFPVASYQEAVVDLQPGDVLVIFTDGVTEALNTTEEEFGEDRLKNLVRRVAHLTVAEITAAISEELCTWIGSAPQHDDLTFVVLKVNDSATPLAKRIS